MSKLNLSLIGSLTSLYLTQCNKKGIIFFNSLSLELSAFHSNIGIPLSNYPLANDQGIKELKKIIPFLLHCVKYNDVREPIKERFNLDKFMNEII